MSIAPLSVCAFADSEKTRNIAAARCDLMDGPFIEQVSLELGVGLTRRSHWLPRQCANYVTPQRGAMPRPSVSTMATVTTGMMASLVEYAPSSKRGNRYLRALFVQAAY